MFSVLYFVFTSSYAGKLYKCEDADGNVTFTNVSCNSEDEITKSSVIGTTESDPKKYKSSPSFNERLNKLRHNDYEETNRQSSDGYTGSSSETSKSLSSTDKKRLSELQKKKSNVLDELERRHITYQRKKALETELNSIDREIAIIHGESITLEQERKPIPSVTGGFYTPTDRIEDGYVSPTGEICRRVKGGLSCPKGFVPVY